MTLSLKQPLALIFVVLGAYLGIAALFGQAWGGVALATLGMILLWISD